LQLLKTSPWLWCSNLNTSNHMWEVWSILSWSPWWRSSNTMSLTEIAQSCDSLIAHSGSWPSTPVMSLSKNPLHRDGNGSMIKTSTVCCLMRWTWHPSGRRW
jgi:hypothetical protein